MAKISKEMYNKLDNVITKYLQETTNALIVKCISIAVLKTKKMVRVAYIVNKDWNTRTFVEFSFKDIRIMSGIDLVEYFKNEKKEIITIECYGKKEQWTSREKAKAFYLDCMRNSEGAERDRYTNIYIQLTEGKKNCTDRGC